MAALALSPKFILLYVFGQSAVFVHFRGRIRHRFTRQLTDHSTVLAPLNALPCFCDVEGESVGVLNKIFAYAYRVRLAGKWLKTKSRFAYYAVKYLIVGGLLYWIFLS
ncbi:MAG: hypothetical protein ABI648_18290 [Betaproteobacteria bacterium]|jgi:aspartyl/asparaginyl beta-hydroxylase (cupin superfamily)